MYTVQGDWGAGMELNRWMYKGGRPNRLASFLNRGITALHSWGVAPNYMVTLEVPGRKTGRVVPMPLVMAIVDDERYLVSMLGTETNWVRNVAAADGRVALRHGRRENVRLEEVPVEHRPPVLRAYMHRAPGGRVHMPVDKDAPLSEIGEIAERFPVFRVVADGTSGGERPGTSRRAS